jgi:hypothetical protein
VSFLLAAVIGVVTSFVTEHPSTGALVALGALVILATIIVTVLALPGRRRRKGTAARRPDAPAGAVPVKYAVMDPEPVFAAVEVGAFTGRQWLVRELDEFLASHSRGYFLVEADAGMGKSAFAAWLVKTRGYLFHFSRVPGGRTTRGALQNLSAQLIKKFRLTDGGGDGVVPEWALTSASFAAFLGRAASQLGDKQSLVLVVDGLDEAEPVPDGMPFGLPALLPPHVFVVATYRAGHAPPYTEPSVTARIRQDDADNLGDIRAYLSAAAAAEPLAGRLREARMSRGTFVDQLTQRSEGVWVYLRYVLAEIRERGLSRGFVANLPAGLQAYYAGQLDGWRRDAHWTGGLLPLLATLGAAGEPLLAATLAGLSGDLDQAAVRRWCGSTLRPLLTTTTVPAGPDGPQDGDDRLFEIYHASFREVLHGDVPKGAEGRALEHALELRRATLAAHGRIADRYLRQFGGLDNGLALLAEDPGLGRADSGYPLRHLARHLSLANRPGQLFQLLRAEQPTRSTTAANVWYQAQDAADDTGHYLDDLHRAGGVAAEATDQAMAHRAAAPAEVPAVPSLGQEIGYALMAASVVSRAKNIPPALARRAMETGLWSPARGLDYARRLPDPVERVEALLAARTHLAAGEQAGVLDEALAAAADVPAPPARFQALALIAASLPPGQRAGVLRRMLEMVNNPELSDRAQALVVLAPRLTADLLPEALRIAKSMTTSDDRVRTLAALAPFLRPRDQRQAIDAALAADRAQYSDDAVYQDAGRGDEVFRGKTLAAFAPCLPADLIDEAVRLASRLPEAGDRAAALTALAPRVTAAARPGVVEQARTAALAIGYDTSRFEALIALAPLLSPEAQRDVFRTVLDGAAGEGGRARPKLLIALGPLLPADLLAEAVTAASRIEDAGDRVRALAGLAGSLPAGQRPGVLRRAVDALHSDRWLLEEGALSALAPHLPAGLLAEVVDTAVAGPLESFRTRALSTLAPHLPADLVARCLAAVTITDDPSRAGALRVLSSYLTGDGELAVQGTALDAALAITQWLERRWQLDRLLPALHPGLLDRALAASRDLKNDGERARALAQLALGRAGDGLAAVLDEALEAADELTDLGDKADLLTALGSRLTGERRRTVLDQALAAAAGVSYEPTRAQALTALGGQLTEERFARVVTLATAIADPESRASALTALAGAAPAERTPGLLDQALAAAKAVSDHGDRAKALVALVPLLPDGQRPDALRVALDATLAETVNRPERLALLAPLLPPPLLAEAVAAVAARKYGPYLQELAAVAPCLPAGQRQDLLRRYWAKADWLPFGGEGLAELAAYLPEDLLAEAAETARAIGYDETRAKVLAAVAARLPAGQREALFREALRAITTIGGEFTLDAVWRTVAALLPVDLLTEALALTPKSTPNPAIAVLDRAARLLPADAAADYLRLLRAALTGLDRPGCLAVIAAAAEAISVLGGAVAVRGCADAIGDAERWWP